MIYDMLLFACKLAASTPSPMPPVLYTSPPQQLQCICRHATTSSTHASDCCKPCFPVLLSCCAGAASPTATFGLMCAPAPGTDLDPHSSQPWRQRRPVRLADPAADRTNLSVNWCVCVRAQHMYTYTNTMIVASGALVLQCNAAAETQGYTCMLARCFSRYDLVRVGVTRRACCMHGICFCANI
jgi:hypothetical protein